MRRVRRSAILGAAWEGLVERVPVSSRKFRRRDLVRRLSSRARSWGAVEVGSLVVVVEVEVVMLLRGWVAGRFVMPWSSRVGSLSSSCGSYQQNRDLCKRFWGEIWATMYWSPKTLHRPSEGSAGGWRLIRSVGTLTNRAAGSHALLPLSLTSSIALSSACLLLSASIRVILSGVKSFQNGGGLGKVDASECCSSSWSAIFAELDGVTTLN